MTGSCARCNAATKVTRSTGGTSEGDEFVETHECANGHVGRVRGVVGEPSGSWSRTGAVFNNGDNY